MWYSSNLANSTRVEIGGIEAWGVCGRWMTSACFACVGCATHNHYSLWVVAAQVGVNLVEILDECCCCCCCCCCYCCALTTFLPYDAIVTCFILVCYIFAGVDTLWQRLHVAKNKRKLRYEKTWKDTYAMQENIRKAPSRIALTFPGFVSDFMSVSQWLDVICCFPLF